MQVNIYINNVVGLSSSGFKQISKHGAMTPELKKYYDQPLKRAVCYIGNEKAFVKLVPVE